MMIHVDDISVSSVLSRAAGGFRKVRGAGRIHFHLSWYLSDFMVPSYDKNNYKQVRTVSFTK